MAGLIFDSEFTPEDFRAQVISDFEQRASTYDSGENGLWHHAVIEELLTTYPPVSPAVDIGCGTGYLTGQLARSGIAVTGVDMTVSMLERARELHGSTIAKFVRGRAEALPFEEHSFNCAYICTALAYFTDVPVVLQEVHRVLKTGGFLALEANSADSFIQGVAFERACNHVLGDNAASVFRVPGHVTDTAEDVTKLLVSAGFQNIEVSKYVETKELNYEETRRIWDGGVFRNAFFAKFNKLPTAVKEHIMKKTIEELEQFRRDDVLVDKITHWFVRGYKLSEAI